MSQIGAFSQHLLTMNSEDPNQEDTAAVDGVLREYARTGGPGDDERFVASVSHRITKAKNAVERDWPWLFGRVFWKAVAAIAVLLIVGIGVTVQVGVAQKTQDFCWTNPQISYGGVGTNITANFCGRFIDSPPLFPL